MRFTHGIWSAFVFFIFFSLKTAYAEYPGVTPGSFSVSDSGAGTYSIPISVPAGVAGMSPELAVGYSSQGGNGLMGVGFGLSGFTSMIHRCGGSHATDGKATGVRYTTADKLCLDSQRLILSSGTHWANGAVYRTELDSFAKIVYTQTGSTTRYFTVYSRDGERRVYGWKSAVPNNGNTVNLRWYLSSEHDRSGNIIRYYYQHLAGETWLPKEVLWTGRGSDLGNRKAVFEYRVRADKRIYYDYGYKRESKHLLHRIKTYIDNNLVKEYRFAYETSPISGVSRLTDIQQCGFSGNCLSRHELNWRNSGKGFEASNQSYELPVPIYDYQSLRDSQNPNKNAELMRGDFVDANSDGYVDFIESFKDSNGSVTNRIWRNTGSGWSNTGRSVPIIMRDYRTSRGHAPLGEEITRGAYADVNGDGYIDIIKSVKVNGDQPAEVWINDRTGFNWVKSTTFVPPSFMRDYSWGSWVDPGPPTSCQVTGGMNKATLIDVNGDGLPDWVRSYIRPDGASIRNTWVNNGSRWVHNTSYQLPAAAIIDDFKRSNGVCYSLPKTELIDINGDGLVDLIQSLLWQGGTHRNVWLNTGSGWQSANHYNLPDYITDHTRFSDSSPLRRGIFLDVNGDGLVDWVKSYIDPQNQQLYRDTWLNTGRSFVKDTGYQLKGWGLRVYYGDGQHVPTSTFIDVNNDGLVDRVVAYINGAGTAHKYTYLNTGSGWRRDDAYNLRGWLYNMNSNLQNLPMHYGQLLDINADGAVDNMMAVKNRHGVITNEAYFGRTKPADLLIKVIDSLDAETTISYKSMMDRSVYNFFPAWSPTPSFRSRKVIGPMQVVANTWHSNGVGGDYRLQYFYYNATNDGKRGFQGFLQRRVWDPQNDVLTVKNFYQQFPATGITKQQYAYHAEAITPTGGPDTTQSYQLLSNQFNFIRRKNSLTEQGDVWNVDGVSHASGKTTYAPRIRRSRSLEYELGQSGVIRSTWTESGYDGFSNPTTIRSVVVSGAGPSAYESIDLSANFYTYTQTTYQNDTANWLIGMPTQVKVTHHVPGKPNQIRETHTQYNAQGLPRTIIVEPNRPEFKLTTQHTYDGFGNVVGTTLSGQGIDSRTGTMSYDARGLHAVGETNALGHSMSVAYHSRCDAPVTITEANGLVTDTVYDQFCRAIRVDHPDGTWATTAYGFTPLRTIHRASNQPDVTTYYDALGRDIKVETQGFDGRTVITEKRYNNKGQITQESQPYYEGEYVYWTRYYYDAIGRLIRTRAADTSESTVEYNGLTTIMTNALNQTQTRVNDVVGRLQQVVDDQNNVLSYDYDAVGNLLHTTDPQGNQIRMGYDHAGRKIWMDDPDMGVWTYQYNVLGELIQQKDAKDQIITTEYDKLGRLTKRTVQPGTVDEQVSTWAYDTAANGIGRLDQTHGPNGYVREHRYDSLSRPSYTFETIDGIRMTSYLRYDTSGRLAEVRYPGRNINGFPGKLDRIHYEYNNLGYLSRIYNVTSQTNQTGNEDLWVLQAMDAKGNATQEYYGNGVNINRSYHVVRNFVTSIQSNLGATPIQDLSYWMDYVGNLTSRRDHLQNTSEIFGYDNLNRLTQSRTTVPDPTATSGEVTTRVNYDYDVLGNLTYRSDVGTMNYGENGYGPHAITSIQQNSTVNVAENVFNPYGNYNYDANGNLTNNGQRTVDWTAFNKPKQMAAMINGQARGVSYTYGSDFQRITKTTLSGKTTRYYGGGSMEHIADGTDIYWKYYIPVGAATLEINYQQTGSVHPDNFTQVEKQYLFKDHLGSTDVIVDNDGNIVERLSFNPWGERRDADWTEADGEISSSTNRGFTGHEMDDEIGLVNMNARIYDPVIGRFLSPDSIIPSATDLQAFNRYSYVRNNPLSFTDPSGFERIRVPGRGSYYYDTDSGKYYERTTTVTHGCEPNCEKGDRWGSGTTITTTDTEITDPGLINHLNNRIGVVNDVLQSDGRLSRGNVKHVRDQALADARAAIGCLTCSAKFLNQLRMQGKQSAAFNAAMDRYAAANEVYLELKSQARKRYRKIGFDIVVTAVGAITGVPPGVTSQMLALSNGAGLDDLLKGWAINIVTQGLFDTFGINPKTLLSVDTLKAIGVHGAIGCLRSKAGGGSCSKGAAAAAGSKLITVGYGPGHSPGKLLATIAVGGAINGLEGATNAAFGYLYNFCDGGKNCNTQHDQNNFDGFASENDAYHFGEFAPLSALAGFYFDILSLMGCNFVCGVGSFGAGVMAGDVTGATTGAVTQALSQHFFKIPAGASNSIGGFTSIMSN